MAGRRRTRRYRPFTVKGMDVLSKAEVVVYDSLVGQGVLSQIPLAARLINVGKRANQHTMPQEQINEVLLKEAKKGYRVVRLRAGIPSCSAGAGRSWSCWPKTAYLMRWCRE